MKKIIVSAICSLISIMAFPQEKLNDVGKLSKKELSQLLQEGALTKVNSSSFEMIGFDGYLLCLKKRECGNIMVNGKSIVSIPYYSDRFFEWNLEPCLLFVQILMLSYLCFCWIRDIIRGRRRIKKLIEDTDYLIERTNTILRRE